MCRGLSGLGSLVRTEPAVRQDWGCAAGLADLEVEVVEEGLDLEVEVVEEGLEGTGEDVEADLVASCNPQGLGQDAEWAATFYLVKRV